MSPRMMVKIKNSYANFFLAKRNVRKSSYQSSNVRTVDGAFSAPEKRVGQSANCRLRTPVQPDLRIFLQIWRNIAKSRSSGEFEEIWP